MGILNDVPHIYEVGDQSPPLLVLLVCFLGNAILHAILQDPILDIRPNVETIHARCSSGPEVLSLKQESRVLKITGMHNNFPFLVSHLQASI